MDLNSNVVIITSGRGNKTFIKNYSRLIRNIFEGEVVLITTGDFHLDPAKFENIEIKNIHIPYSPSPWGRIKSYLSSQLMITRNIPDDVDVALFFLSQSLLLPMLKLKFSNKKVCLILGSSDYRVSKSKGGLNSFLPLLEKLAFKISDYIFIYSNNLKKEFKVQNYENKIKIMHRHFLDFEIFNYFKPYSDRDKIVGYIGRFSNEKGIINFIESMPEILENDPEIKFSIIGDGVLRSQVMFLLEELGLDQKVEMIPRVEFEEVPKYLNEMRLVVLPSYTEGLPNVVIEAMACGTPVLANPVGSVPDIISDKETGFILENNSPQSIAEGVINSLNYRKIDEIIKNSQKYVKDNFSFQNVLGEYENITKNI